MLELITMNRMRKTIHIIFRVIKVNNFSKVEKQIPVYHTAFSCTENLRNLISLKDISVCKCESIFIILHGIFILFLMERSLQFCV